MRKKSVAVHRPSRQPPDFHIRPDEIVGALTRRQVQGLPEYPQPQVFGSQCWLTELRAAPASTCPEVSVPDRPTAWTTIARTYGAL